MYALRLAQLWHDILKPCCASTAELAELMCSAKLNSSAKLNWFQTSCLNRIAELVQHGSGTMFDMGLTQRFINQSLEIYFLMHFFLALIITTIVTPKHHLIGP